MYNYHPILVLPCFSKYWEESFVTHVPHSSLKMIILMKSEHVIVHLVNEILKSFDNNIYILDVFVDLTKALQTVD